MTIVVCLEKDEFIPLSKNNERLFQKSYKISLLKKHGNCYRVGLNKRFLNIGEYKVIHQIDNSYCN